LVVGLIWTARRLLVGIDESTGASPVEAGCRLAGVFAMNVLFTNPFSKRAI
jgi:hypothetical protein